MKIQGQHRIDAPRELVWRCLMDPEVLSKTLPGMQDLREVKDHEFEATMKIKVGPVQGQFAGGVSLSELQPPESYRMQLDGKGTTGFVRGTGQLQLQEAETATDLLYELDLQIGGRIASVGQRLLESSSKVLTQQALESLEQQILARREDGAGATVRGPSQAAVAGRVTRRVLADLVPTAPRPLLLGAGLILLLALVTLFSRGC